MSLSNSLACLRRLLLALSVLAGLAVAQPLPDQVRDQTLGVVNCASSLCHGSIAGWDGSPVVQNEYVVWSRLDKHARAYGLLTNAQSRSIAAKLGLAQPAHLSRECVDCHAHNPAPVATRPAPAHSVADGISCEGCHGPAQRWVASHTAPEATHQGNIRNGLTSRWHAPSCACHATSAHRKSTSATASWRPATRA